MTKLNKKITITIVSLFVMIGLLCATFIGFNMNGKQTSVATLDAGVSTVSDVSAVPLAGIEDIADGVWTLSTGQTVKYYFRADDGAFWTRDHLEYKLQMSKVIPDLKMSITYRDSKNNNQEHTVTYYLGEKVSYQGEDRAVTWNQVERITVKLYTNSEDITFRLYLRHD